MAQRDTAASVVFGAFVDTYYAWDVNQPRNFDRAYTTQAARHAEFNVNLAYLEAKLTAARYRGRLALQFGTSVQANYLGEPAIGRVSGASVSQYVQEATIGYAFSPTVWVDGGIFFAHTGYESWISRDNLSYTRSLIAEFSPYYEAGVKVTWAPSRKVTAQLDIVNGWQDISSYNTPPAIGVRIDYAISPQFSLSYDNFVGNVAADSLPVKLRVYNDFIAQYNRASRWQFAAAVDVGSQSNSTTRGGTATWYGGSVFAKYHSNQLVGVVARVERYADPSQVIVQTRLPYAFKANGASFGVDVTPTPRFLWRTELRGFGSRDPVWPNHKEGGYSRHDLLGVTSMALTI